MNNPKRYWPEIGDRGGDEYAHMVEATDGGFISTDDHEAAVAWLRKRIRELENAISEMANAADDSGECEGFAHYGHMNVCRIRDRVMGGQKSAVTEADRLRHALHKVTGSLGLAINGADASAAGHVENYLHAKSVLANQ